MCSWDPISLDALRYPWLPGADASLGPWLLALVLLEKRHVAFYVSVL